jgi:hypothetical protein
VCSAVLCVLFRCRIRGVGGGGGVGWDVGKVLEAFYGC